MVEKKDVVEGWPLETGDYDVGNPQGCVAVVTLGSKMNEEIVGEGAAIAGPLHTENLGIEKLVTNIISNPNLRFLIICGSEVQGHITGETVEALYNNGIDEKTKSIIGSPGAIPFVENLSVEAVERFQEQISIVSMINNENINEISEQISNCTSQDPGAYPEDAMIIELNEKEEETTNDDENYSQEVTTTMDSSAIELMQVENRLRIFNQEIKEIGSIEKFSSGYYAGKIEGIVIGFIITTILLLIIIWGMR